MRFEFHPEALAEYEDAARHYAGCQNGLERWFIAAVEHVIQQIIEAPGRWPVLEEDIRRCLTRVFPYAVLYSVETDYVLIISLMHSHREPGYWRKRIKNPAN
jgi:plasmid stabilization system protein ParE